MSIPSKLREARRAAGLTQAAVAKVFSISREAVALWESEGEKGTKPDIRKLQTLAELYKVSVSDLLDEPQLGNQPDHDYLSTPASLRRVPVQEPEQEISFSTSVPEAREVLSIWEKMSNKAKDEWIKIGGILLGDVANKPAKPTGKVEQRPPRSELCNKRES